MTLPSQFRRRAETMSIECRLRLGRRAFDPLPAHVLLESLGGRVMTPGEIADLNAETRDYLVTSGDWSAALLCIKPLTILVNPTHSHARRESDLMHEIAHLLLKHPPIIMTSGHQIQRDRELEGEATYLGGCLQVPRRGLQWAKQQRLSVSEIAQHFLASEAMIRYRMNITGVHTQL